MSSVLPPPQHIAIIMDGNGRWAKKRLMPRLMGHRAGTNSTKAMVEACNDLGVKYLTVYAFSSENWARPFTEVDALMKLMIEMTRREIDGMMANNVRFQALGNLSRLPEATRRELETGIERTKNNTGIQFNIAVSYGGREEIVDAARQIARKARDGALDPETLDEAAFTRHLYLPGLPDPELLIRTGGDLRISNFLLWQVAYTELYVTDVLWPDFGKKELLKAIEEYHKRQRRFGKVLDE
ncbi:MAG TPA: isoprenyl transferase [Fibrobacteria bacterium]|nr:isoprenyl transferase [Fibrobacteria bacterium]